MNMRMKIEGLAALEKKLNALPAAASKKVMRGSLMSALAPMVKAAKEKVAVRSGALKKAIRRRALITKGNDYAAEAGIHMASKKGEEGWRWHFEEFGTSGQRARPFIRPAFDETQEEVVRRFKEELARRIDKEAKKR